MNLLQQMKADLLTARKNKDEIAKKLLSTVIGEVEIAQSRAQQQGDITEQQICKIIQKVIKANSDTIAVNPEHDRAPILKQEISILENLLPKLWTMDEIMFAFDANMIKEIKAASNDGQATGLAMKILKSQNAPVDGKDVAILVKNIRGG